MPKFTFPSTSSINIRHPFQFIFTTRKEKPDDDKESYYLAVVYYSSLYKSFKLEDKFGKFSDPVEIKGLNEYKKIDSFPQKKIYCVLEIPVKNLDIDSSGKIQIQWVEGEDEEKLAPIEFESSENLRQTKARIIIGVLLSDKNEVPKMTDEEENQQDTEYVVQYVNTNLLMINTLVNGTPVIYPVPFSGGIIKSDFQ